MALAAQCLASAGFAGGQLFWKFEAVGFISLSGAFRAFEISVLRF